MTEPLPIKVPKPRTCKDCPPRRDPLRAPHPGPRCHRHNQIRIKADRERNRERDSQKVYGMPPGFFRALLAFQGGTCGGCGRKLIRVQRDHDHSIADPRKAMRGLLCRKCNDYLGYIRDDQAALTRLRQYLREPPAQALLMVWDGDEDT